jgi:hypothetical protein
LARLREVLEEDGFAVDVVDISAEAIAPAAAVNFNINITESISKENGDACIIMTVMLAKSGRIAL